MMFQARTVAEDYGGGIHLFPAVDTGDATFAESACSRSVPLAKLAAFHGGLVCQVCLIRSGDQTAETRWAG